MNTEANAPKIREIAHGIYQFMGLRRAAHTYLVKGQRRIALIDSGLPTTVDYLCACLKALGLAPEDIDLVLLTHEHIDHAGGAPFFAKHALVAAHPHAANKLLLGDEFSLMSKAFQEKVSQFQPDILLAEGMRFELGGIQLEVIGTPGHCSGSVCFYEPRLKHLFSGDTIMANGIVGGVLASGNVSDYITSLHKLQRLNIQSLLPGHGRTSDTATSDLEQGLVRLHGLLEDSHVLFTALRETEKGFDDVMRSLRDLNTL